MLYDYDTNFIGSLFLGGFVNSDVAIIADNRLSICWKASITTINYTFQ